MFFSPIKPLIAACGYSIKPVKKVKEYIVIKNPGYITK